MENFKYFLVIPDNSLKLDLHAGTAGTTKYVEAAFRNKDKI